MMNELTITLQMTDIDICAPPVVWLEGRCYRVTSGVAPGLDSCEVRPGYTGEAELETHDTAGDLEDELQHTVEQLDTGNFRAVLALPAAFFPQIIGKGGQTKARLETDTKTKIVIPRKGQEGDITVTGISRMGVITACNRIDVIVASARQRQPFTHFLSIPVTAPHVQEAFLNFKSDVLESCENVRGLDSSIFQTETLLHLTIGTMSLLDERERTVARFVSSYLSIFLNQFSMFPGICWQTVKIIL